MLSAASTLAADISGAASNLESQKSSLDQDQLNVLAGKTLPDILRAAYLGTNQAYAGDQLLQGAGFGILTQRFQHPHSLFHQFDVIIGRHE